MSYEQQKSDLQGSINYMTAQLKQVLDKLLAIRTDDKDVCSKIDTLLIEAGDEVGGNDFPDYEAFATTVDDIVRVARSLKNN